VNPSPQSRETSSRDQTALALGTHSEVRGRNTDPARHMVGLTTDDIMKDWKRLVATFKDPEGNMLQLLQFDRA
jgi:hypothetical protein